MTNTNQEVINKIAELYADLYDHDGFGGMTIDMRILKRNQKEIILKCGCEYRYVVDWVPPEENREIDLEKPAQNVGAGPEAHIVKSCDAHSGDAKK